jgi:hypothetical protein
MVPSNLSVCISIFENEIQSIQCQKYERNLSANSIGTFGALSPKSLITSTYVWWCDQSMDITLGDYAPGLYFLQTIDFIVWVGVDPNGSNPTLQTLACLEACLANNARIDGTLEHAHVSPPPHPLLSPKCAKTIMKSTSKLKQSANPILEAHAKTKWHIQGNRANQSHVWQIEATPHILTYLGKPKIPRERTGQTWQNMG